MSSFRLNLHSHQTPTVKNFFKPVKGMKKIRKDDRIIITQLIPSLSEDNRVDLTVKRLVHNIVYESLNLQSVYLPDRLIPTYQKISYLVEFTGKNQITFSEDPNGKQIPDMDSWIIPCKYQIDPGVLSDMIRSLKAMENTGSVELSFIGDRVSLFQESIKKGSSHTSVYENLAYSYPVVFSHLFTPSFLIHVFECLKGCGLIEIGLVKCEVPEGIASEFQYIPWSFCGYTTTENKTLSYKAMIAPRVSEE